MLLTKIDVRSERSLLDLYALMRFAEDYKAFIENKTSTDLCERIDVWFRIWLRANPNLLAHQLKKRKRSHSPDCNTHPPTKHVDSSSHTITTEAIPGEPATHSPKRNDSTTQVSLDCDTHPSTRNGESCSPTIKIEPMSEEPIIYPPTRIDSTTQTLDTFMTGQPTTPAPPTFTPDVRTPDLLLNLTNSANPL